ncbi:hypothetical protein CK203_006923 [Vitis vinifera]|uniref:Uncharacterized protein n=1 Tax=Vitis vinifera TaxID=29760 RepID=A0A438KBY6_VITVI|nr:hypothetical protein CK203_006923 [Vitis vinifera]
MGGCFSDVRGGKQAVGMGLTGPSMPPTPTTDAAINDAVDHFFRARGLHQLFTHLEVTLDPALYKIQVRNVPTSKSKKTAWKLEIQHLTLTIGSSDSRNMDGYLYLVPGYVIVTSSLRHSYLHCYLTVMNCYQEQYHNIHYRRGTSPSPATPSENGLVAEARI